MTRTPTETAACEDTKLARLITIDDLRRVIRVDEATGKLYWLERPVSFFRDGRYPAERTCKKWNTRYAGKEAFTAANELGYLRGNLLGKTLLAHRVIFALVNGNWPHEEVDHINGVPSDNRPENLRAASHSENMQNVAARGKSGFLGVMWRADAKKWHVKALSKDGKSVKIGWFNEKTEAARAYDAFVIAQDRPFARLNFPSPEVAP